MDSLPPEMIEYILKMVDGHSLIRAKDVCKKWNSVAKLFDKNQSHWKRLCVKEVTRSVLIELTVKVYPYCRPNDEDEDCQLDWKVIYLTWLRWKVVKNLTYYSDAIIEHKAGHVTCIKIVDDSIVIGMHSGEIKSWHLSGGETFLVSRHSARVTCLEVVCILDERKEANADKRLNYILSTSQDKMLKISYLIKEGMEPKVYDICRHEHKTVAVRVQQSYFAVLDEGGAIAVFVVSPSKSKGIMPMVNFIVLYHPSTPSIISLDLWGSKVSCMSKKGVILVGDFFEGQRTMNVICKPEKDAVKVIVVADGSSYISKVNHYQGIAVSSYYHWRNDIFMWITENHRMLISLNGYKYYEYNILEVLKSYPTSAMIYGNMLILGMESGSVVMYYFEAPENLLSLDLQCYQWLHQVTKSPVSGLDIWENSSASLLVVLSQTDIHLIEWALNLEEVIY